MNTEMLKKVRKLFNSPDIPAAHNRSYQKQWAKSIRLLGERWLLAKPVRKEQA